MRQYVTFANLLTSGSLAAGFLSVPLIFGGGFAGAAGLIALAAVFDLLDGYFARRAKTEDEFGTTLDALADVVSFGAAPALALYLGSLHTLPILGFAACLAFFLCGAWRLARFTTRKKTMLYFVGCPLPVAGVLLSILAALDTPPILALPAILALSSLMIGTTPFPTFAGLRNRKEMARVVEEYRRAR